MIDVVDLKLTRLPVTNTHQTEETFLAIKFGRHYVRQNHRTSGHCTRAPFVALSYVWGQGEKTYRTTRRNVMLYRQHGGLEKAIADLPRALQDSIELVRGMLTLLGRPSQQSLSNRDLF